MLSELLRKKYTHLFNILDADGNGVLEKEDNVAYAKRGAEIRGLGEDSPAYQTALEYSNARWEKLQAVADKNADGVVSLDEYLHFVETDLQRAKEKGELSTIKEEWAGVFDMLDIDGSGEITLEEYRIGMQMIGVEKSIDIEENFKRLDIDGDGVVSRAEAMQRIAEFYFGDDPDAPGNYLFGPF